MERQFTAGGVVYKKVQFSNLPPRQRADNFQILWLVTKSTPSKELPQGFWRLPKGWLDDEAEGKKPGPLALGKRKATEDELQSAALREVREEGGIAAKIVSRIGTEKYFLTLTGRKILKFVTFYLMEWMSDLPDGFDFETEEVLWLSFDEARKKLKQSGEKKVLDKASKTLEKTRFC